MKLNELKKSSKLKVIQRIGRGPGSGRGKTSGRGHKGAGSRSGYKRRYGYEGGQMRLFCKLPHRGFSRGRFIEPRIALNLSDLDKIFIENETVSIQSLYEKGCVTKNFPKKLKILSRGELNKKLIIKAHFFSKEAIKKLEDKKIEFEVLKK